MPCEPLTNALKQELDRLADPRLYSLAPVDSEDAHSALAQYLEHILANGLASFRGGETDEGRNYFRVELPVHPQMPGVRQAHDEAHDGAHEELRETEARVLRFVEAQANSRPELAAHLGLKSRSGHLYKAIDHLRNLGYIELTIPDKPQSKNQKVGITEKGQAWLASHPH
jgi:ATP-dependent DNA helicase RecG